MKIHRRRSLCRTSTTTLSRHRRLRHSRAVKACISAHNDPLSYVGHTAYTLHRINCRLRWCALITCFNATRKDADKYPKPIMTVLSRHTDRLHYAYRPCTPTIASHCSAVVHFYTDSSVFLCVHWSRRRYLVILTPKFARSFLLSGNKRDRIETLAQCAQCTHFAVNYFFLVICPIGHKIKKLR